MRLVNKKLEIWWKTADNVLELNKQAVRSDSKKLYVQKQRSYYDIVVDLFMVNL